eukprot:scaffold13638_cov81-Cyclotella_meneghiniana.AAC.5
MVENSKRKKFHDKDKYYRLAKEQGYRSRAAFKLTQINRKFNILQNARTIIDLCAAPGGWTQVCARSLPNDSTTTILAVDILPIRNLNSKNVITLIGDITTEKCKATIRSEMQGVGADVVLCDGAPNVGASYDRDAYDQNELALHALKCACEHLRKNGTFVTKLYRSADYSAYLWVAKQFFDTVQAVKPSASRSQSAEIFLVDGQATGGGDKAQTGEKAAKMNIFHKEFGKKVRSRNGYDMSNLDASMRNIGSVANFLEGGSNNDPIQLLSDCTGLAFYCHVCRDASAKKVEEPACNCKMYLNHRLTTPEIKTCLSDLKVLNKSDFKGLLMWRDRMRDERKAAAKSEDADVSSDEESRGHDTGELDSDAEDAQVQLEIEELRKKKLREIKRKKKKERELAAKRRQRAAFGMDLNAIDVPDNDKIFSLASITTAGDLEAAREVDLEKVTDEQLFPTNSDDEDMTIGKKSTEKQEEEDDSDDDAELNYSLEAELDAAYNRYLTNTKDGMAKSGTKMAKRTKRLMKQKALEEAQQDVLMVSEGAEGLSSDAKKYAEMLQGTKDSDDSSDDDSTVDDGKVKDFSDRIKPASASDDDGDDSISDGNQTEGQSKMSNPSKAQRKGRSSKEEANPLIFKLEEEPTSVKTSRWFNLTNKSLFESIENTARSASFAADITNNDEVQNIDSDEEEQPKKRRKNSRRVETDDDVPLEVDDIIASIPKTDKQKRHEKRLKSIERMERRNARREREAGMDGDFKVVAATDIDDDDMSIDDSNMSETQKKKLKDARALIKAGMGTRQGKDASGFEVVPSKEQPLPVVDTRKYDSEEEDYDSDDYIKTLALGTMILRKSKEKAMVDASYNRFAWNDPEGLPDWFVDDENKHYRPQLPIPPELLEKMRQKVLHLSTKPIAKVAEARARKSKMARAKLAAAKKKAEAVANSSEMSETMKLKAISKAMRGKDASKPGKTYVVAKKGSKGGKGIKLVDKREKNDKRGMERAAKKKKLGKKGGLTGSKRRRNHK